MFGHTLYVNSVVVSPDSKYVVSGSADGTIRVWDLSTGESICTLEGHNDWVNSVAVSPESKYIVSGSSDETIRVWEIIT